MDTTLSDIGIEQSVESVVDPLSPAAPISHLLSIQHNPRLVNMTQDELMTLVQRLRTLATSSPTLTSKLKSESDGATRTRKTKPLSAEQIKRKALLEEI